MRGSLLLRTAARAMAIPPELYRATVGVRNGYLVPLAVPERATEAKKGQHRRHAVAVVFSGERESQRAQSVILSVERAWKLSSAAMRREREKERRGGLPSFALAFFFPFLSPSLCSR